MSHLVIAQRFYNLFREPDTSAVAEILDPRWVNHPADPGRSADVHGFLLGIGDLRAALDSLRVDLFETLENANSIACRIRVSGRFVAPFAGIAPTGLAAGFDAMDLHRIRDNHIVETWHFEHLEQLHATTT